jgi:hypothetical protein
MEVEDQKGLGQTPAAFSNFSLQPFHFVRGLASLGAKPT